MEFVRVIVFVAAAAASLQHVVAAGLRSPSEDEDRGSGPLTTLRRKRSLVYPDPSTLLLIFGLGTPLQLERESVIVGAFAKMIYNLPTANSTAAAAAAARNGGGVGDVTDVRPRSRWSVYRSLGQLAQLYGFGEGKACVLRSICEAAAAPFDRRLGLLHQLLQTVLSPSSSRDEYDEYQDQEYHKAESLGRRLQDADACCHACHALYPDCRSSPLDVFSSKPSIAQLLH